LRRYVEDGISFGGGGHSSTMDHGDFYLDVLPKIYVAYSHEVEVDLEDSDDEVGLYKLNPF
jgi:hypothetical protein